MKLRTLNGREVKWNPMKYQIDWDHKVSGPQKAAQDFLRPYWQHDLVLSEARIPSSLLRIDIWNVSKGVVVEVSPTSVHSEYNPFFHGSVSGYRGVIKRDLDKARWVELNGLLLIEIGDDAWPLTKAWFTKHGVDL